MLRLKNGTQEQEIVVKNVMDIANLFREHSGLEGWSGAHEIALLAHDDTHIFNSALNEKMFLQLYNFGFVNELGKMPDNVRNVIQSAIVFDNPDTSEAFKKAVEAKDGRTIDRVLRKMDFRFSDPYAELTA